MPRTQAQLLDNLRSRIDEPSARLISDEELRRWINEGAIDICRRAEVLEDSSTIAGVAGTLSYTLPTDMTRAHLVEWSETGDDSTYTLEYRDFASMDEIWGRHKEITENLPTFWTVWGFVPTAQLIVYPAPHVAGTFTVYYYRLPTRLTETDPGQPASNVEVPEGWEDLIVDYGEYHALRKDSNNRWQEAKAIYDEKLAEMIALTRRHSDQAGTFVHSTAGGLPDWLVMGDE